MSLRKSITSLDLNLLSSLNAILEERNVTKAAARLHVSQPAMSQTLKRLRDLLGDHLLTRAPNGSILTPRAVELLPLVREIMRQIEVVFLDGQAFDPSTSKQHFTLVATDYSEMTLLPALSKHLATVAPHVRIQVTQSTARIPHSEIIKGSMDAAIGFFPEYPADFYQRKLFQEEFVTIMRAGHPLAKKPLTLESYAAAQHVLVAPWGGTIGLVDDLLEKHKLKREVKRWVTHFQSAPLLLVESDYVATIPKRIAAIFVGIFPLVVVSNPLVVPGFSVFIFWHERTNRDPAQAWLRRVIGDVAQLI